MANRAQRRQKPRKRNPSKADLGIKAQLVKESAIEIAAQKHMQIYLWFVTVAMHDELGVGAKRWRRVMERVDALAEEWHQMCDDGDREYANEKLRQRAEQISGVEIGYI